MRIKFRNIESFLKHTKKTDSCWYWQACKDRDGYGQVTVDSRMTKAHRLSWMIHKGDIPNGMLVCHTCDNTSCVNPEHLFLGSVQDNSDDMKSKNRQAKGKSNGNSKLDEYQVKQIKHWLSQGCRQIDIAEIYSVTQVLISTIKLGKTWSHVTC